MNAPRGEQSAADIEGIIDDGAANDLSSVRPRRTPPPTGEASAHQISDAPTNSDNTSTTQTENINTMATGSQTENASNVT